MEEDKQQAPNTRFPQRPQPQAQNSVFKQPAKNYYKLLKLMTAIGESTVKGTAEFLTSAAKGPVEFGKKVVENIEEGLEIGKEGPSLLDIVKRLQEKPGTMKIEEDTNE
tara:strand:- start:1784 stop:2110 length:327 start_codon:yes stop_codon:yes gene_type:complete